MEYCINMWNVPLNYSLVLSYISEILENEKFNMSLNLSSPLGNKRKSKCRKCLNNSPFSTNRSFSPSMLPFWSQQETKDTWETTNKNDTANNIFSINFYSHFGLRFIHSLPPFSIRPSLSSFPHSINSKFCNQF